MRFTASSTKSAGVPVRNSSSLAMSRSLPAGLVRRAEIVLLCADGLDNQAVAERVRISRQTVGKWRERFRAQGLMRLYDERRPGRPRAIEDEAGHGPAEEDARYPSLSAELRANPSVSD